MLFATKKLLQEISLSPTAARKNSRSVDLWKQTKHPKNVDQLKPIQKVIEAKHREKLANQQ